MECGCVEPRSLIDARRMSCKFGATIPRSRAATQRNGRRSFARGIRSRTRSPAPHRRRPASDSRAAAPARRQLQIRHLDVLHADPPAAPRRSASLPCDGSSLDVVTCRPTRGHHRGKPHLTRPCRRRPRRSKLSAYRLIRSRRRAGSRSASAGPSKPSSVSSFPSNATACMEELLELEPHPFGQIEDRSAPARAAAPSIGSANSRSLRSRTPTRRVSARRAASR